MNKPYEKFSSLVERVLPWLILAVLLFYSYIDFFQRPFGIAWLPDGTITDVFVQRPAPTLMAGDHLVQVGSLLWETYHADLRKNLFDGIKSYEVVPIVVDRAGQQIAIQWQLPGFTLGALWDQLTGQWFLAYLFWLGGMLTMLLLRPKDERWWLLSAFDFLTAIWLIAGSGPSNYHLWYSALVLRVAVWLSLPIYLHLHWVFPRPLGKLPPMLIGTAYAATLIVMVAQWLQLLPESLYFLAFLLAVTGSLILMVLHFFRQPEVRREVRLFTVVVFYAFVPSIILGVTSALAGTSSFIGSIALVSLAALPFAYLYGAYRRQLGGLEVRINRLISAYFFLAILGVIGLPLLALADRSIQLRDATLIWGSLAALIASALAIWVFPLFQNFVERSWLGISLPSKHLEELYSARITSSASLSDLLGLIQDEIVPSLLIRQFAFIQFDNNTTKVLLLIGVEELTPKNIGALISSINTTPLQLPKIDHHPAWVRLALPLKVGDELLGLWLLGRRDPDDLYPQAESSILQSLANQTAIALSNILQTERLKSLYEADVNRYEGERQQLALDLHDNVLNQMATLSMSLDVSSRTPNFQNAYDELAQRLREIVSDLRPPMLAYGLKPAIEALGDNMMERINDSITITVDLQANNQRYSQSLEQHIFRIVQEACQNAVKYSGAKHISIFGQLDAQKIELNVLDDGAGFAAGMNFELKNLLANKHFGLAGMIERAELIGAEIKIYSTAGSGTRVQIIWNSEETIEK